MDIVLNIFDNLALDRFYATVAPARDYAAIASAIAGNSTVKSFFPTYEADPISQYFNFQPSQYAALSEFPRNDWRRQLVSLSLITWVFGFLLYFLTATFSYVFIFDKRTFDHPKFLKNQIRQEIITTMKSIPFMALLTAPAFLAEVKGYSFLYWNVDDYPRWWMFAQFPAFIAFTDCFIYLIHRGLHHPMLYKRLHKPHHKWIMPTPYASHAFHPLDGYAQSIPYHVFPFIFPLQKFAYIAMFIFINIWTVMIHDGEYVADHPAINGAACHTMHHLYFNYNYGQFTTLWDRLGGSYKRPDLGLFDKERKMAREEWSQQVDKMETIVKEVEGGDDRDYGGKNTKKTN